MYVEIPIQVFIDKNNQPETEEVMVDELENMDLKEVKDVDFVGCDKSQSEGFKETNIFTAFNKDVNISKKHPDMFTIDLSGSEEPNCHVTVVHEDKDLTESCPQPFAKPE